MRSTKFPVESDPISEVNKDSRYIATLRDGGISLSQAAGTTRTLIAVRSEVHVLHLGRDVAGTNARPGLTGGEQRKGEESEIQEPPIPSKNFSQILHSNDPPRFFGGPSCFRDDDSNRTVYEKIEHISDLEFRVAYMSNIRDQRIVHDYMTPELIDEIHFDGPISQCNFEILLKPLVNLKLLELHISSLEDLALDQCNMPLYLENLQSLDISSKNFLSCHAYQSDMCAIINNALYLLQYLFPNLTYLSVSMPAYEPLDVQWTHTILNFVSNHYKTIKYLNLDAPFKLEEAEMIKHKQQPIPQFDLDLAIGNLNDVQLASFHYYSATRSSRIGLWRKFLRNQNALAYLQLWCEEYYFPIPYDIIERNGKTLQTLALNCEVPSGSHHAHQINGTVFAKCPVLMLLFLKGNSQHCHSRRHQHHLQRKLLKPDIFNVSLFPKSLHQVKIIDILMDMKDVSLLARSMPYLKNLYLRGIGDTDQFGMDIVDLHFIVSTKRFNKLDIVAGINRPTIDLIPEESGLHTIAKILLKTQKVTSFRAKLMKGNGEYDLWSSSDTSDDDSDEYDYEDESWDTDAPELEQEYKSEQSNLGAENRSHHQEDEPQRRSHNSQRDEPQKRNHHSQQNEPQRRSHHSQQDVVESRSHHSQPDIDETERRSQNSQQDVPHTRRRHSHHGSGSHQSHHSHHGSFQSDQGSTRSDHEDSDRRSAHSHHSKAEALDFASDQNYPTENLNPTDNPVLSNENYEYHPTTGSNDHNHREGSHHSIPQREKSGQNQNVSSPRTSFGGNQAEENHWAVETNAQAPDKIPVRHSF